MALCGLAEDLALACRMTRGKCWISKIEVQSKFRLHVTLFTFFILGGFIVLTTATIFKIKGKLKLCYFSNMYGGIR